MGASGIRRRYHVGFTGRWNDRRDTRAGPSWELPVEWKKPLMSGPAFARSFTTPERQARIDKHQAIPDLEQKLERQIEVRDEAKAALNQLEAPQRSDFPKGAKGEVAYEDELDRFQRVYEKLHRKWEQAMGRVNNTQNEIRRLQKEINEDTAYAEITYELGLLDDLERMIQERRRILEPAAELFERDLEEGRVVQPHFSESYAKNKAGGEDYAKPTGDNRDILKTFEGQKDPGWFLAKLNGKLAELGHAVREAVG